MIECEPEWMIVSNEMRMSYDHGCGVLFMFTQLQNHRHCMNIRASTLKKLSFTDVAGRQSITSIMIGSTTSWMISKKFGCPIQCAIFFFLPVNMLSITVTWWPANISLSTRWLPTNPEPPVTRILNFSESGMTLTRGYTLFSIAFPAPDSINMPLISALMKFLSSFCEDSLAFDISWALKNWR